MTNGEKIQEIFKGCDVCEPIIEDNIIHVIFVDKNDSAIGFDWDWWNMEYKEPTPTITLDDLKELREEIEHCSLRYNLAREQGCQGQVVWSEYLYKQGDVLAILDKKIAELEAADDCKNCPPVTPQEPILDKIRAEIERQEKWLMIAGYNCYNVDIAFNAIKSEVAKYKAETEEE